MQTEVLRIAELQLLMSMLILYRTTLTLLFLPRFAQAHLSQQLFPVVRAVHPGDAGPAGMGVVFVELGSVSRQLVEKILVRR